jgi:hypothetical protein
MKKLRVGFLLDNLSPSTYVNELIEFVDQTNDFDRPIIITGYQRPTPKKSIFRKVIDKAKQGPSKFIDSIIWLFLHKLVRILEEKTAKRIFPKYLSNYEIKNINELKIITIEGKWSRSFLFLELTSEDITTISACELDCIIRCGSGILRGDILDIPKFGVISFHHGDNRVNRGGPSGFWEVLNDEPTSGFVIQKLNQELDGGEVLIRGNLMTADRWLINNAQLLEKSNVFMMKLLQELAVNEKLSAPEGVRLHSNKLFKLDLKILLIKYLCKIHLPAKFSWLISWFTSPLDIRWSVAYNYHDRFSKSLWRYKEIKNPKGRFLADPFVIENNGENFIFVEDLFFNDYKGRISVIKVDEQKYDFLGVVLEEDFHLSFPFVFKYEKDIYMIPESCANSDIRLYKSKEFPFKWEFEQQLMTNVDAADTMLFEHDNFWFMLTNICSAKIGDHQAELHIFYSEDFRSGNWQPIKSGNPVIFNSLKGRNGGFFRHNGVLYRINQVHGKGHYGKSFKLNKIEVLSRDHYVEKEVSLIEPNFKDASISTHHFTANENVAAVDFARLVRLKKTTRN